MSLAEYLWLHMAGLYGHRWQYLDHWLFSRSDTRDAERQLRTAYDFAVERRMCGDEFPVKPAGEITHEKPEFKPASSEVVEARMAEIRDVLGAGEAGEVAHD